MQKICRTHVLYLALFFTFALFLTGGRVAAAEEASCSSDILSTGAQLSESRMQIEKQQIDEAVSKPASVMEMSCIEQFGEMFNREIGGIFGNTDGDSIDGVGLEFFNFEGIFTETQNAMNQTINDAINNGLLGGRGLNIGGAISDTLNSMLGGISGGSGNVDFTCEAMNLLWEIMQCQDIFDFKIPTLNDIIGDFSLSGMLEDIMPDSCAGQVLTQAALDQATNIFSSFDQTLAESIRPSTIESQANSY
jgi:phage-related protein